MAKNKIVLPKLMPRGSKGLLYFRRQINGKDRWICTKTTDEGQAKQILKKYMESETTVEALSQMKSNAHHLAQDYVQVLTGKTLERIPLNDAYAVWASHSSELNDVTAQTKNHYCSIFALFVTWCHENELNFMDEIDQSASKRYAKHLWEKKVTPRTFNGHLKVLSRIFESIDLLKQLPHRNPFHCKIVHRKRQSLGGPEASHQPLEPEMLKKVMEQAALAGQDFLDLFIIGSQTGMRLKDAALLQWNNVQEDFVEITPSKTAKHGNNARVPISKTLKELFKRRLETKKNQYVIPTIASFYISSDWVKKKSQDIFIAALDAKNIYVPKGDHRKKNTPIYGFHSFRTTFMSLLATRDVSTRDAMRMLGWESPEMIQVYEKMLEKARGDSDRRAKKLVDSLTELQYEIPPVPAREKKLVPTKELLIRLMPTCSNVDLGKIFGISDVAIKKWMNKFGIERTKRIMSQAPDSELTMVRQKLLETL